jgi:hypothetical protein
VAADGSETEVEAAVKGRREAADDLLEDVNRS